MSDKFIDKIKELDRGGGNLSDESPDMAKVLLCIHVLCKATYENEDPRLILKMIEAILERRHESK